MPVRHTLEVALAEVLTVVVDVEPWIEIVAETPLSESGNVICFLTGVAHVKAGVNASLIDHLEPSQPTVTEAIDSIAVNLIGTVKEICESEITMSGNEMAHLVVAVQAIEHLHQGRFLPSVKIAGSILTIYANLHHLRICQTETRDVTMVRTTLVHALSLLAESLHSLSLLHNRFLPRALLLVLTMGHLQ